ncbi:MAG: lipid-A-disaccharide synthase [Gloeomargarita sp. SKYBB_i_bin120]|nr:lipid-A-disaccharide synthase [Gloeomargarita sp. SKYG98]MCS7293476.1 lipid-A-disaccharide synthase [Gloeomargarita sp. SKYB120]MDW8179042.1 lipid-A-disaccharide synthase [Gloeomargarita sp. SKYBB_i_bin120]
MPRILISTGEVSGDLQGALLVQALRQLRPDVDIWAIGGPRMAQAGAQLLADTTQMGSIGLIEHLPFVLPTLQLLSRLRRQLASQPPDVVVLIDYVGFNLPLARLCKPWGCPLVYYIAPQEWVWPTSHTSRIVRLIDHLLAVFPQEADYYRKAGVARVEWVGHPLVDVFSQAESRQAARQALGIDSAQKMVVLLPASRRQELRYLWPVLAETARQLQQQHPDLAFWIPVALPQYQARLQGEVQRYGLQAKVVQNNARRVMAAADLALTKSGTVNLELALLGVPQLVIYRVSPVTAWLARHVLQFQIEFMSPVNLIAQQALVPEFLQEQARPEHLLPVALDYLQNPDPVRQRYQPLRQALGPPGAVQRAAQVILTYCR